jgi:gluconate 2-dehydrogenase gamma chain
MIGASGPDGATASHIEPGCNYVAFERLSTDTFMDYSRRDWICGTLGSIAWAEIAAAREHAHQAATGVATAPLNFFDEVTGAEVAAIAGQILPSDDGPGAKEAGVIFFIDRALTTFDTEKQDLYRTGLKELRQTREKMYPGSQSMNTLPREQQVALVHAIEETEFFEAVRTHTMLGFLGAPGYGGNRDKVGWKYIGFEDRMAWEPPFGYYDAEAK